MLSSVHRGAQGAQSLCLLTQELSSCNDGVAWCSLSCVFFFLFFLTLSLSVPLSLALPLVCAPHVSVCVCMCSSKLAHVLRMCVKARLTFSIVPWEYYTLFCETDSLSSLSLLVRVDWLFSEPQGSTCLHLPNVVGTARVQHFSWSSEDWSQVFMLALQTLY